MQLTRDYMWKEFFMIKKFCLLLMLVSLVACGDNIAFRRSSDYATRLSRMQEMAVYPAKAEVNLVDIAGSKERQYNYEYFIEDNVSDILATALNEKGYHTKIIHKKDLKNKKGYKEFDVVFDKFREEKNRIFTEKDSSEKIYAYNITTNLGKASPVLSEKMGDEIAIFADYTETLQTSGAQALTILIGSNNPTPSEAAFLTLGILDLKNQKILWTYHSFDLTSQFGSWINSSSDDKEVAKDKIKAVVNRVLEKFPNKNNLFDDDE